MPIIILSGPFGAVEGFIRYEPSTSSTDPEPKDAETASNEDDDPTNVFVLVGLEKGFEGGADENVNSFVEFGLEIAFQSAADAEDNTFAEFGIQ